MHKISVEPANFFFALNMVFTQEEKSNLIDITNSVLDHFDDLKGNIDDKSIAIIAHWKNYLDSPFGSTLGKLFILSIPWHLSRLKSDLPNFRPALDNITDFQYVMVLANKITSSRSKVEMVFTIAHELQHLSQYIHDKESTLRCFVLFRYFCSINDPRYTFSLPHDHDAIRRAKSINYQIHENEEVDNFIIDKIQTPSPDNDDEYWHLVKRIDPCSGYSYCDETESLWIKYENEIKEAAVKDSHIKEAYNFLLSTT